MKERDLSGTRNPLILNTLSIEMLASILRALEGPEVTSFRLFRFPRLRQNAPRCPHVKADTQQTNPLPVAPGFPRSALGPLPLLGPFHPGE